MEVLKLHVIRYCQPKPRVSGLILEKGELDMSCSLCYFNLCPKLNLTITSKFLLLERRFM